MNYARHDRGQTKVKSTVCEIDKCEGKEGTIFETSFLSLNGIMITSEFPGHVAVWLKLW